MKLNAQYTDRCWSLSGAVEIVIVKLPTNMNVTLVIPERYYMPYIGQTTCWYITKNDLANPWVNGTFIDH